MEKYYLQMLLLLSEELFPTSVRSLGTGLCLGVNALADSLPPLFNMVLVREINYTYYIVVNPKPQL